MARIALRQCYYPGCTILVRTWYCKKHLIEIKAEKEKKKAFYRQRHLAKVKKSYAFSRPVSNVSPSASQDGGAPERGGRVEGGTESNEDKTPRESASKRGYGRKWQKARLVHLHKHPLCVVCRSKGRIVAADEVDHIVPHHLDWRVFWDRKNWQSLCSRCHGIKTAIESGAIDSRGVGRKPDPFKEQ